MYKIVLPLSLGVTLVSRDSFETEAAAFTRIAERYQAYPAVEVWTEEAVEKEVSTRKVTFPEKEH